MSKSYVVPTQHLIPDTKTKTKTKTETETETVTVTDTETDITTTTITITRASSISMIQYPSLIEALETVASEDLYRNWPAERTIMLRMISKRFREAIDKIRPPAIVCFRNIGLWNILHNCTLDEKLQFTISQLITLSTKCSITTLELDFCKIKFRIKELIKVLNMSELKKLSFINNVFNNDELETILIELEQSSVITLINYINLSYNYINCHGVKHLAEKLIQCKALTHLDLSYNNILANGAISLAKMLPQCTALTLLKLDNNNISNGVNKLAETLPLCRGIEHIDLSNNYINRNGAKHLAKALPECAVLAHFDISYNCIGIVGAINFSRVLKRCTSLTYLNLNNTGITSASIDILEEVLRFLPNLHCTYDRLDFYPNSFLY